MLFLFKLMPEEDDSEKEYVDRELYGMMSFYFSPGIFHAAAPVDVIEYDDGTIGDFFQQLMEVSQRRLFTMVGIDERKIYVRQCRYHLRQCIVEVPGDDADI